MQVEGFLCWDGVEIVNTARTLTYIRRGLAGPEWDVKLGSVSGDPYDPADLACYCAVIADDEYVDPATDEAPWYVAGKPDSEDFLGLIDLVVEDRQPQGRSVRRLATGGASIGPWIPGERSVGFTATLVASSARGMEWGRRWLSDALHGGFCKSADTSEVRFLPACPESPTDETAFRWWTQVGLIDPPTFTPIDDDHPECYVMLARWQIACGTPWLVGPPIDTEGTATLDADESTTVQVSTDEWNGEIGVTITVEAVTGDASDIRLTAYPMAEGWDCPEPGSPNPCYDVTIDDLPTGGVIEILSAQERAIYHNPTSKQDEPIWSRVTLVSEPFLIVPACSSVCVVVTNASDVQVDVTIETVVREL